MTKKEIRRAEANTRYVERKLLDEWIWKNNPGGVARLAIRSGFSASVISLARLGRVPILQTTRQALAESIGATEDQLFPLKT